MTDKEAMKLALDALEANYLLVNGTETHGGLEQCLDGYYSSCFDTDPINKQTEESIAALKERLAQLPQRTEPPQRTWVGLTYKEKLELYRQFENRLESDGWEYEKAIEAKLKEKNT